jgi:hypothetical protein
VQANIVKRHRGAIFVLILTAFSLLIALGGNTPFLKFLYDNGIATAIRYPEKFSLIAIFALTIFSAQMLQRRRVGDEAIRESAAGFALATTVVAVALAILSFTPMYAKTFMSIWGQTMNGGTKRMIALQQIDWIVASIRGAFLFALFLLQIFPPAHSHGILDHFLSGNARRMAPEYGALVHGLFSRADR